MKRNIFILFILLAASINAQDYHIKYINKISPHAKVEEDVYVSKNNVISVRDSIVNFNSSQTGKVQYNENTNSVRISSQSIPNKVIIEKVNGSEFVTIFEFLNETKYEIKDKLPPMKWEINYKSSKVIENYTCFEATTNFRGSEIIAYFTKEIPYSAGPFKFSGLPGTILEVSEKNSKFNIWIATMVKKSSDKPKFAKSNAKKIDLIQFLDLVEKENDKFFLNSTKALGSNVTVKRMKVQRQGIAKIYEWEKISQ